jgi:hypothetical protein
VENEELIGTLIETNERIIAALDMYDKVSAPETSTEAEVTDAITAGLAAAQISSSEVNKLQSKQRAAVERAKQNSYRGKPSEDQASHLHPDLQELNFGPGGSSTNLPPPMRPSSADYSDTDDRAYVRGSLSDFSDYESSDEDTHNTRASSSKKNYVNVSDNSGDEGARGDKADTLDPFADPFADDLAVGSTRKW